MEEKIQRTFVRQIAYEKLRNWILNGILAPGAKLRDKDLAEKLGVSRTPIREALLRLEEEGLVQTKPNLSTQVSSIEFDNAFHLYSIVWTLEKLAITQAFEYIKAEHVQKMIDANEKFLMYMEKRDRLAALNADHDFHAIYITLSQNEALFKIISELKAKLKRLDLYYYDQIKDAHLSYKEHQLIIEALKQNDLHSTINAIESNWKNSFSRFNIKGEPCLKIN